jgi:hypothetical protein
MSYKLLANHADLLFCLTLQYRNGHLLQLCLRNEGHFALSLDLETHLLLQSISSITSRSSPPLKKEDEQSPETELDMLERSLGLAKTKDTL